MNDRNSLRVISMLTISLLVSPLSYGADIGRKAADQNIIKKVEAGNEGAEKRVKKRAQARALQETGKEVEKIVQKSSKPASYAGSIVSIGAAATGDPHAKLGAAGFKLSIEGIKALGIGIAKVITITGRYQERAQAILSGAELELEDLQKLLDKKKKLEKELDDLLKVERPGQPSESSSKLKQLGKGAVNLAKSAEIKVRQATDILTNDKEDRGKKIEAIQDELKEIDKKYKERISSLEIRVIYEIIKEIDKKINIDETIRILEDKLEVFARAREDENLSKNKSKRKRQQAETDAAEVSNNTDLIYFMKFKTSPTESLEDLKKSRAELMREISALSELTDRGDAIYLQEKDVKLDSDVNRAAIVGIYKEIDAIKSQLFSLGKTTPSKDVAPVVPPLPLATAKSQAEPLQKKASDQVQKKPSGQVRPVGDPTLQQPIINQQAVINQKEKLNPFKRPSSMLAKKAEGG